MTTSLIPVHAVGDPLTARETARIHDDIEIAVTDAIRRMPKYPVYIASVMEHRVRWRSIRRTWAAAHDIRITSSWIDAGEDHDRQSPLAYAGAWCENYRDIEAAKSLLCYAEPGDTLRGALVEAGIALGQHKPVIIVGPVQHPSWGSWQYHPLVHYCASLEAALTVLATWRGRKAPEV